MKRINYVPLEKYPNYGRIVQVKSLASIYHHQLTFSQLVEVSATFVPKLQVSDKTQHLICNRKDSEGPVRSLEFNNDFLVLTHERVSVSHKENLKKWD